MNQAIETLKKMTGKSEDEVIAAITAFVNSEHASVLSNINHPSIINAIAQSLS